MTRPTPIQNINVADIVKAAEGYMDEYDPDESDGEHYLTEAIMEAVFGPNVYDYLNSL